MTQQEWIACVLARLGYATNARLPHDLTRRIESMWLQGISANEAILTLTPTPDAPTTP